MVTDKQIVERANEILQRDGWCQGTAHNDDGEHCVMGAIGLAYDELVGNIWVREPEVRDDARRVNSYQDAVHLVADEILKESGTNISVQTPRTDKVQKLVNVPIWNDAIGRTVEDVHLVLKKAAHG